MIDIEEVQFDVENETINFCAQYFFFGFDTN